MSIAFELRPRAGIPDLVRVIIMWPQSSCGPVPSAAGSSIRRGVRRRPRRGLSREAEATGAASRHDAPEKARPGAAYMAESALLLASSGFLARRCVAEPE
jgi:hypothetical protein